LMSSELQKMPVHQALPTRRDLTREESELAEILQKEKLDLREYYSESILDCKRQERILLGRARELSEFNSTDRDGLSMFKSGRDIVRNRERLKEQRDLLTDSLEHRFAQRVLLMVNEREADKQFNGGETDDSDSPRLNDKMSTRQSRKSGIFLSTVRDKAILKESGKNLKKQSKLKAKSHESVNDSQFPIIDIRTNGKVNDHDGLCLENISFSKKCGFHSSVQREREKTDNDQVRQFERDSRVHYDAERLLSVTETEYFRPHTLLDVDGGVTNRESRVLDIVQAFCEGRGELSRLTAIKEVSF
jgi:hypothetical protein